MDREKAHTFVFPEDGLGTVTVMDIPVDDKDSGYLMSQAGFASGNSNVID
jgi:hypothetical protein